MAGRTMTAEEFDAAFDAGDDISDMIDWTSVRRLNQEAKRVNVDFPVWMVQGLDKRAAHLGITRQSLIKMWIAEKLEREGA